MKISKLHLADYRRPFKVGFHSPQTHRHTAESILLRIVLADGSMAYGECAPRNYVTGESSRTVRGIMETIVAPVLHDADVDSLDAVTRLLVNIETRCLRENAGPYLSALAAVDLALMDALGKQSGAHIADVIGRPPVHEVARSISIPFLPTALIESLFHRLQGYIPIDSVKVLMKNDLEENIQRVGFIRSLIGPQMPIRLEANGKWTLEEALTHAEHLSPLGIISLEEPIRHPTPDRLRHLRQQVDMDIILDESVCSHADAVRMIREEACDGFNLKLSKCGGILRLMAIADDAWKHRLKCQLGTHVGEGPVLDAVGRYAASSHEAFYNYEGYSSLLFLDLDKEKNRLRELAQPAVFQGPGIGPAIDGISGAFVSPDTIELSTRS